MNPNKWNNYDTSGFTVQHGRDGRANGGITHSQVRRTNAGQWMIRKLDVNGRFKSSGPHGNVSTFEGVELFKRAQEY